MPKFEGAPIIPPEGPGEPEISGKPETEEVLDLSPETVEEFERRNEAEAERTAEAISQLETDPKKRKEAKSKLKRLALTLGLAGFVAGSAFFLTREKEVAEAEEAEIRSVEYEAGRERAREILSEKLGMDMVETAERHGFTVHLKVDNGDGNYIVHVGQSHRVAFSDIAEILGSKDIIHSQKSIHNLLRDTAEQTNKRLVIFQEGFDKEHTTTFENVRYIYIKELLTHLSTKKYLSF